MRPSRIEPGPGRESVWDYPRPPRLEPCSRRIEIAFGGVTLVDTDRSFRFLETSHPPTYYVPRDAVRGEHLIESPRTSFCEWKGVARYVDVRVGDRVARAAGWFYPRPSAGFEAIRDHVAFYPAAMDACRVDGEIVTPQPGRFYGGWITSDLVGPFKGGPGTEGRGCAVAWTGTSADPGTRDRGVIDALGEGLTRFALGDRVGLGWHGGHDGTCDPCLSGHPRSNARRPRSP